MVKNYGNKKVPIDNLVNIVILWTISVITLTSFFVLFKLIEDLLYLITINDWFKFPIITKLYNIKIKKNKNCKLAQKLIYKF